jgi:hypothetical protein
MKLLQTAAPKPAPTVKWRDMDATIRHEGNKSAPKPTTKPVTKPPQPRGQNGASTTNSDTLDISADTESDGFEHLNRPPPDLTGLDGRTFTVTKDINLSSPVLLNILGDKAPTKAHTGSVVVRPTVGPVLQGAAVAPKASEWDEW